MTTDNTIQRFTGGDDNISISSNQNTIYGAEGSDTFTGTTNRSTLEGGVGGDSFNLDLSNNNVLLGGDDSSSNSLYVTGGVGNYLMGAGAMTGSAWARAVPPPRPTTRSTPAMATTRSTQPAPATRCSAAAVRTSSMWSATKIGCSARRATTRCRPMAIPTRSTAATTSDSVYLAGGQHNTLIGGAGNDWVGGNGDNNQLLGGDGADWLGVSGSQNVVAGDAGADTLFANGIDNRLIGGAGNDWVGVSGNSNMLFGGDGDDYVAASGNTNVLDGGAGNDQLVAGGHTADTFVFQPGYGQDQVSGFLSIAAGGSDIVDLQGFGITTFGQLQSFMAQNGANVVINLGGDVLTLSNVVLSQLQAGDFHLA